MNTALRRRFLPIAPPRPGLDPGPPHFPVTRLTVRGPGSSPGRGFGIAPSEQPVPALILLGDLVCPHDGPRPDQRAAGGGEEEGEQGREGRQGSGGHGVSFHIAGHPCRSSVVKRGHPVGGAVTGRPVPRRFPR